MKSAIQRRHWRSISVAAGPSFHAPAFVFVHAASDSARIPIIAPDPFTYAKCRGEPIAVKSGTTRSLQSVSSASADSASSGRSATNRAATCSGVTLGRTLRRERSMVIRNRFDDLTADSPELAEIKIAWPYSPVHATPFRSPFLLSHRMGFSARRCYRSFVPFGYTAGPSPGTLVPVERAK